jgi:hypothetical protein
LGFQIEIDDVLGILGSGHGMRMLTHPTKKLKGYKVKRFGERGYVLSFGKSNRFLFSDSDVLDIKLPLYG